MRKYGKRMMALCLSLLMLMLAVVPSSASEAGITDQETVLLTVEKNGNGKVEITGEQVVQEAEDRYAVKAGTEVAVKLSEAEGSAPGIAILNEQEISDTFYMPETDQVLSVTFANLLEEDVLNENVPEENAPEENVPEKNVPEENVPEENVPEENVPEENVPEENVPEENVPEENAPGENVPEEKMPEEVPKLLLFSGRAASGTVTVNGSGITPDIGKYGVGVGSFTVNFNGKTYKAYCACHERKGVTVGMRLSASVTNSASIRKCLYYGNGGPQDRGYGHTPTSLAISVANGHMDSSDTGETDASIGRNTLAKINALPNPPASFLAYYAVSPDPSFQDIAFWTWGTGKAMLKKASANPEMTENNPCYSLEGARYGVFKDQACQTKAGELVTDENGDTNQLELGAGTYYVKELEAPEGYALDSAVYSVNVEAGKTAVVNVKDRPQNDPIDIILGKYDGEKTYNGEANLPQGAATLAGAEFTVKFYSGLYDKVEELEGIEPKKSWVFKTDSDGIALFSPNYLVSGDEFYLDSNGNITLPLGTVTIQETKAPEGYQINEEAFLRQITPSGDAEEVRTYNMPQIPEKVVKGSVKIKKYGIDPDDKEQIKTPLEGIEFVFTSKTTQEVVTTIVTDENGNAMAEDLPFDTYLVTEENTPENYIPCDPFEVTIQEEGEVLSYVIDNKEIRAAITIVKKDAETGKIIPVSGTTFRILDAEKKPISMRAPYPGNQILTEFQTDQSGTVTLPERLKYGTYYLEEVKAPEGYLKGELLEFHIDKKHDYERPLVVEYYDENIQGQIQLKKIDQETKEALAGAEFTVQAAEDIVTPDGTVRAKKGEIVDTIITDHDGKGISKKLFLGKYKVRESKQPEGYVLEDTVYEVELVYQDQMTELIVEDLGEIKNVRTLIKLKKVKKDTDKTLEGVIFHIWEKGHMDSIREYVTDQNGNICVDQLKADTVYCIQEKQTLPGYVLNEEIIEVKVDSEGLIEGKKTYEITLENDYTQIEKTIALDSETKEQNSNADGEVTVIDTVSFKNLVVGEEYIIKGKLMDRVTGEPLLVDGEEVTAEKTFIPETQKESVENIFTFNGSMLAGKTIVVFEELYTEDVLIATHINIEDEEQTIYFPKIRTTAKDGKSGTHVGIPKKESTIIDTVAFENLVPEKEYTIKGKLMDRATGKPFLVDGKEVTEEKTFIPETPDGKVEIKFTFDSSSLNKKSLVVFEEVYLNEKTVAVHADIEDEGQTVTYKIGKIKTSIPDDWSKGVRTGDNSPIMAFVALFILSFGMIGILLTRHFLFRKDVNKNEK